MKKKTLRKLELLLHFLTAFMLLLKGCDQISRKLYFPGTILLLIAIAILTIIIYRKTFYIAPKQARLVCYYLESPALAVTAYILYLEEKQFLPHLFVVASLLYPAVGFISSKKFRRIARSELK